MDFNPIHEGLVNIPSCPGDSEKFIIKKKPRRTFGLKND